MERVRKGFTLIELLVVVAIIAILAAIAVPQYNKYRANAMLSNVQQLTKSIASQAADLATTASQGCPEASNFVVKCNNGVLKAYAMKGGAIDTSKVCDEVNIKLPGWVSAIDLSDNNSTINTNGITLTNNGTSVSISGAIFVESNYNIGNDYFGCKYDNNGLDLDDNFTDSNTYYCKIIK